VPDSRLVKLCRPVHIRRQTQRMERVEKLEDVTRIIRADTLKRESAEHLILSADRLVDPRIESIDV